MGTFSNVCDFTIKIIMLFTTVIALLYFASVYTNFSLVFGLLALILILSIIAKGLVDIFTKE